MEKTISIRNTEITFSIWDLGGKLSKNTNTHIHTNNNGKSAPQSARPGPGLLVCFQSLSLSLSFVFELGGCEVRMVKESFFFLSHLTLWYQSLFTVCPLLFLHLSFSLLSSPLSPHTATQHKQRRHHQTYQSWFLCNGIQEWKYVGERVREERESERE